MKSFAALIAALGFVASSAFAETAVKTQYFYQTEADKNQGTADLGYSSSTIKYSTANITNTTMSLMPLTLRYERGLSDMFSVGAQLAYLLGGASNVGGTVAGDKYDVKGMSDLMVFMRGQYGVMSNMSIHYGLNLNAALGKAKTKNATGEGQTEASYQTGGMGLTPYVGMAYAMDSHIIGARLTTSFDLGKRKTENQPATGATTTSDVTGGNRTNLAAFYETAAMGAIVGAELYYGGTNTTKTIDANGAETTARGYNSYGLNLYSTYDLNEMTTLLARVGYDMGTALPSNIDSTNAWNIGVAGRFTF